MKSRKFPRTFHFDFSEGVQHDDKIIKTLAFLEGQTCIASLKMDGENTTCTNEVMHARSIDSKHHPSRNWVKGFHAKIKHLIPDGYRICGENLYARHSIAYDNLKSYFYGFSVWNEKNVALSWHDTLDWFELLSIVPVPVIGDPFIFSVEEVKRRTKSLNLERDEGLVVRVIDEIPYDDYGVLVAKWVRAGHVQSSEHWAHQAIIPNKLAI